MATAVFRADRVLDAAEKEIERLKLAYEADKRALVAKYQHYRGGLFKLQFCHRTYQEALDWLEEQELFSDGRWQLDRLKDDFERDMGGAVRLREVARSSQNHGDGLISLTVEECIWIGLNCDAAS